MLRGAPRGAIEALFALQVEEATALRTDMREVVEELRAHHARHREMAELRTTADHQILEAVTKLITLLGAFEKVVREMDTMPTRLRTVLDSADVTQLHKTLADALEVDIWARLGEHSEAEAQRLADLALRVEKSVQNAVGNLRDARAGKPAVPPVKEGAPAKEMLLSLGRHYYARLLRVSGDIRHLAAVVACACVAIAALSVTTAQLLHIFLAH